MASACGSVKLTVAVTVIPSGMHASNTSSPAAVAGSFTAMLGAQEASLFAISSISSASPGNLGFT